MATMTLTTGAFPIFASRNWINQDSVDYGTFTADEMSSLLERVIDGDPLSYWHGSSESDATTVTMTFQLMNRSVLTDRAFDLVCLQNINWKNFLGQYSTDGGSNWSTITGMDYQVATADNAETDLIVNIPAGITANAIKFSIYRTITANQQKKAGGIVVCQSAIQLAGGFADYKVDFEETIREMKLGDGTVSREYLLRSAASYERWGASFDCPIVTAAELSTLRTIKREGYPFIFIPEPGDNERDVYLCHFNGRWGHAYMNPVRSVGYMVPMKVKEVGTHV